MKHIIIMILVVASLCGTTSAVVTFDITETSDKQTFASGENYIHGSLYRDGVLWASLITHPAKYLRINASNLSDYTKLTLDSQHYYGHEIVYAEGYIVDSTQHFGRARMHVGSHELIRHLGLRAF